MSNIIENTVFIINPHSGKQKYAKLVKKIRGIAGEDARIFISGNVQQFDDFIRDNIDNFKYFVIAGGDGTVNGMAQHLFGKKDKVLAVIPRGSGNGFARELGFNTSLKNLFTALQQGDSLDIDVLELNGKKFINAAGLGFDSCVAHEFANMKSRGLKTYIRAAIQCLKKFNNFNAEIVVEGTTISDKFKMITFANTRQFGNNAIIAPKAHPADGKMDIVLVKPMPSYVYPDFAMKIMTGKIKDSKYVSLLQTGENIKITTDFNIIHIDGEPAQMPSSSQLNIYKGMLKVLKMKPAIPG